MYENGIRVQNNAILVHKTDESIFGVAPLDWVTAGIPNILKTISFKSYR